jgi:hypothetical protein
VFADDRREPAMDREQADGEFAVERRMDRAGGNEGQRVAPRDDDAPPGMAEPGSTPRMRSLRSCDWRSADAGA